MTVARILSRCLACRTTQGHTIADLASLAGVTPRTIPYYVSVGLIPAPDQMGRAARYTDGHLDGIRLIRRLQDQHLPLAEIRARLASLSDAEVTAALAAPDAPPVGSALDYIRALTTGRRQLAASQAPHAQRVAAQPAAQAHLARAPFGDPLLFQSSPARRTQPHQDPYHRPRPPAPTSS
ncbi:MAG: MerR family transcriptional regulator [Chloroflexota bacterium]